MQEQNNNFSPLIPSLFIFPLKKFAKTRRHASTGQIISPTILFLVVSYGRDRENLPSGYKPVFFGWMGWMDDMGWDGWDGWDGGTSTNFALTYVLDTKIQSDFSQFCPFQTDFSQFCHFQR